MRSWTICRAMATEHQDTATIDLGYQQLQAAPSARELPARETDSAVDWDALKFKTTAELEPLNEIIGQSRAIAALEVGLGVQQPGYNIYAAGLTGTSKTETIKDTLQKRLAGSPPPDDWVYVHNFDDSDQPWAIRLKPGQGQAAGEGHGPARLPAEGSAAQGLSPAGFPGRERPAQPQIREEARRIHEPPDRHGQATRVRGGVHARRADLLPALHRRQDRREPRATGHPGAR